MIAHKTLRDLVYDYICQQIRAGKMHPSSMIKESILSEELEVSRTPVREALIQLASEGLLECIPHKGFRIKPLGESEARDLFVVIGQLEGLAASLAIPLLTEKELGVMQDCIDTMDFAIQHGNNELYLSTDAAFHEVYLLACKNTVLFDTMLKLKSKLFKHRYLEGNQVEHLKTLNNEHRHILVLLREHKSEEVSRYFTEVHWTPNAVNEETFV